MPAHSCKLALFLFVTFFIPFYFIWPKINVGFGQMKVFTVFMTMPKATIHKNDCSVFAKYQIRMAWKTRMIYPIAEASVKKEIYKPIFQALYPSHVWRPYCDGAVLWSVYPYSLWFCTYICRINYFKITYKCIVNQNDTESLVF